MLHENIKAIRTSKGLSQQELAVKLNVVRQTISKWEQGKGLPDISLLTPLSAALGVSVLELMSGDAVRNRNRSANLLRTKFYVCPICGNIIHAVGEVVVSCCGVALPPLEAEAPDQEHHLSVEEVEDEHYVTLAHPMTKTHYISFLAYVTSDRVQLVKLYPEGSAACRFPLRQGGYLYWYCNRHGLLVQRV